MLRLLVTFRAPIRQRTRLIHCNHVWKDAFSLRPYQEACLESCLAHLGAGQFRIGVSLPTGSGKTTVFVTLISRLSSPQPHASRALVIVNSIELANQAARQVAKLLPDVSVEIEQGSKNVATGTADITIATYQTLLRPQRLVKFDPKYMKVVIIDEAHHAAAPSYLKILSHFNPSVLDRTLDAANGVPIVGFSATFGRHDGMSLGAVFDQIVYHRDFLDMIKEKWLCGVRFTSVAAKLNLSAVTVSSQTGDFNANSLAAVINSEALNSLVVKAWLDRASTRKSTLIFCVNIAHIRSLTQAFRSNGVDARFLHSGTPVKERAALLDQFRTGQFPVLVNCAILTEGADVPNIDCVVVARPTRSRNVFAQMIGRGMRLSPSTSKKDCHIIDFVDSTSRVTGVVSTPTLFGLNPIDMLEDETLESLEKKRDEAILQDSQTPSTEAIPLHALPEPTSVTYTDYDNPFSLVHDASGSPHVAKLSPNAWVAVGADVYVLECLGKGSIRIQRQEGDAGIYEAYYSPIAETVESDSIPEGYIRRQQFRRPRQILLADSLSAAIQGSDTFAKTKVVFGNLAMGLLRSARWRKLPATEKQKGLISKRLFAKSLVKLSAALSSSDLAPDRTNLQGMDLSKLTKGQAANIINRLKYGAKGQFEKSTTLAIKKFTLAKKEQLRVARERIAVGPLQ